jgi:plastocyanin
MNSLTRISGIALLALSACVALGQSNGPADQPGQTLSGDVSIVIPKPSTPLKDASRVVEWLVPTPQMHAAQSAKPRGTYKMVQRDKMFQPNFLVVPVGSIVNFPNLDPWFHNVFSLYRGKKFDLGLYEAGSDKQVRFDRPGASFVFCNIHPEMTAVVLTVDSEYYGVSDKTGRLTIAGVPEGSYVLKVWYENATPEALQALTRQFAVGGDTHTLPAISVVMTKQYLMKHKNKYGHDYDPNAASPVY